MAEQDVERCQASGPDDTMCVLAHGHKGGHHFQEVPCFQGELVFNAFCPHCGSRPALDGPGCKECGGGPP